MVVQLDLIYVNKDLEMDEVFGDGYVWFWGYRFGEAFDKNTPTTVER